MTAKAVATLDHLAGGGRVLLGIGVGWLAEEFAALGLPFEDRGPRTDEYVAAMRALWSQECASFKGRFISFDQVVLPSAAAGAPHPDRGGRRHGGGGPPRGPAGRRLLPARTHAAGLLDEMRRAAEAAGRDPKAIEITLAAPTEPPRSRRSPGRASPGWRCRSAPRRGCPRQLKTPEDVLRYGREVIARFR